ncbi:ZIP family metal transporter [Stutzerimonas tarimensis]|uniref:ZIP family metal transporter n=1 Tax=Stutzerimonas tarimensis TaxID=1507735 RepID=A0ABV7T3C3_9GAMM
MSSITQSFRNAWLAQIDSNRWVAAGLAVSAAFVLVLLVVSIFNAFTGIHPAYVRHSLYGGFAGFAATGLGALLALCFGNINARTQDTMLGFAAGMMLAASSFSLILPGIEAAEDLTGSGMLAAATVVLGLGLGVLLMLGLDRFTPHAHESTGPCGPEAARINKVWLFVLAITLHNLPEGMAIGVGFGGGDLSVGIPLAAAIAIQDIPEGLAVAIALRAIGLSRKIAVLVALGSGIMEPIGALVGVGISSGFALAYPVGMGLAAGAMIFVVSHEIIPETHRNGHQTPATLGLTGGFGVMMFLDTALG